MGKLTKRANGYGRTKGLNLIREKRRELEICGGFAAPFLHSESDIVPNKINYHAKFCRYFPVLKSQSIFIYENKQRLSHFGALTMRGQLPNPVGQSPNPI